MKVALVQLGDIYIKSSEDLILGRGKLIASAVRAHTREVDGYPVEPAQILLTLLDI